MLHTVIIGVVLVGLCVATWAIGAWLDRIPTVQGFEPGYDTRHPRP